MLLLLEMRQAISRPLMFVLDAVVSFVCCRCCHVICLFQIQSGHLFVLDVVISSVCFVCCHVNCLFWMLSCHLFVLDVVLPFVCFRCCHAMCLLLMLPCHLFCLDIVVYFLFQMLYCQLLVLNVVMSIARFRCCRIICQLQVLSYHLFVLEPAEISDQKQLNYLKQFTLKQFFAVFNSPLMTICIISMPSGGLGGNLEKFTKCIKHHQLFRVDLGLV